MTNIKGFYPTSLVCHTQTDNGQTIQVLMVMDHLSMLSIKRDGSSGYERFFKTFTNLQRKFKKIKFKKKLN